MIWKPTLPLAGSVGARIAHWLRRARNRLALQRRNVVQGKAPRTFAREAIWEAETVLQQARAAMRPSPR